MELVFNSGTTEVWRDTARDEFYAYAGDKLVRVCPSLGMAREVLAGY
jgi:hypothetical protein